MKHHITTILMLLCIIVPQLTACSDSVLMGDDAVPSAVGTHCQISSTTLAFGAQDNLSQALSISASDASWQFEGMADWLKLSATAGSSSAEVQATATANVSGDDVRTSIFDFHATAQGLTAHCTMTATQQAEAPRVQPAQPYVIFNAPASSETIAVDANTSWTPSCSEPWISVAAAPDGSAITISVEDNTTGASRSAEVWLNGKASASISVSQKAANVMADKSLQLDFPHGGGTLSATFSSDLAWTSQTTQSWLAVTPKSGAAGKSTLQIVCSPNTSLTARTGAVDILIAGKTVLTFTVIQDASSALSVTPTTVGELPSKGGTHRVSVATNAQWTAVRSHVSWMTLSAYKGTGNADVTITIADNPSISPRAGTVTFMAEDQPPVSLNISQAARYLRTSVDKLWFFSSGGKQTFSIDTDALVDVIASHDWLTTSRNGNVVTVNATPLPAGTTRREGKVTLKMADLVAGERFTIDIPIVQFSETSIDVTGFGGDENWTFRKDIEIRVTIFGNDEDWGSGQNVKITITGFGNDEDWNLGQDIKIYITDFGTDESWDSGQSVNIYITDFGNEDSWDFGQNVKITISDFSGNENWDPGQNVKITITDFGGDENLDPGQDVNIGRTDFGNDENLDPGQDKKIGITGYDDKEQNWD